MSDLTPGLLPPYHVDSVEFRDRMVVVTFTEPEQLQNRVVQDHTSRVIMVGDDGEIDAKISELLEDVFELIELAHVVRRSPPTTRPSGL